MGYLQEADCFQLRNAGDVARQKGILPNGQVLKCPFTDCDRINCQLIENPLVTTIYIASAQPTPITPLDRFYNRLNEHFKITRTSQSKGFGMGD